MIRAHTAEQVRAAEQAMIARLPEGTLMARAAAGLAGAVADLLGSTYGRRVLVLAGSGDNGGDALYAGAALARRGAHVEAWLLGDHAHEPAIEALKGAGGRVVDGPRLRPEVVVDGIVGTGGRPGLEDDAAEALKLLHGIPVVGCDVPSGVGVDTGEVDGDHVEATLTVTFGSHKICQLVDPAAQAAGAVVLVDIGLELPEAEVEALQQEDVVERLRMVGPGVESQKYSRGVVGVRAGSAQYPGAGLLSVGGASCGLAGMVRYVGDDAVAQVIKQQHPEVVGAGRVQAWIVGSGGGERAGDSLRDARADGVPVVIDADALQHVDGPVPGAVLTPHAGELAAMLGEDRVQIEARPLHFARAAAEKHDATVLLKGRRTVVARPDGRARVNTSGTSWLATAGAGDVLGGLVAALLAAGLDPFDAASVGAWLHGSAAALAGDGGPIVAGDVVRALPVLLRRLLDDDA